MHKQLAPHLAGLVVVLLLLTPVFVFPGWTMHVRSAPVAAVPITPSPQPTLLAVASTAAANNLFLPLTLRDAAAPPPQPPIPPPPTLMKEFQLLALVDFDEHAWDGKQGAGSDPDHRGDAVLYCIRKDRKANGTQFSIVKQPAEVLDLVNAGQPNQRAEANMGDPATLKKFAEWSIDYFPAKKYALILWSDGTGYGWKVNPDKALGPGNDNKRVATAAQDAQSDALEMKELRTVLADVKSKINAGSQYKANTGVARRLDLLGIDLGHMALIDVGRQVQESVEVLVASEERIHADGWPYREFLAGLKCQRQASQRWQCDAPQKKTADEVGKDAVAVYHTYYEDPAHPDPQHTLSATRLNPTGQPGAGACATFDALVNCVSTWQWLRHHMLAAGYALSVL